MLLGEREGEKALPVSNMHSEEEEKHYLPFVNRDYFIKVFHMDVHSKECERLLRI